MSKRLSWLLLPCLLTLGGCSSSDLAAEHSSNGEAYVIRDTTVYEGAGASHDEARRQAEKDALLYNHGNSRSTP
jgi:hypothetical protein